MSFLDDLTALIEERYGLACVDWQRQRLEEVLCERRGRALSEMSAASLSSDELRELVLKISIGETYFYRESPHLEAFAEVALPERLHKAPLDGPLRILSAGCSSGEELYSLAIRIAERYGDGIYQRLLLQGVDLSAAAIKRARRGRYSKWSLRTLPDPLRQRYFRKDGEEYQVLDELRSRVLFEEGNLLEEANSLFLPGLFDIIFCRNVIIYLSDRAARSLLQQLHSALVPGGFLFLGHSETLRSPSVQFEALHSHDTVYYRKTVAAALRLPAARSVALSEPPRLEERPRWFDVTSGATQQPTSSPSAASPPRVLEAAPSPLSARQSVTGQPLLFGALGLLIAGERFIEAAAVLDSLAPGALLPSDETLVRAVLLMGQGRIADAEHRCRELLQSGGHVAAAHYILGQCREHGGDRVLALSHYRQAMSLDPTLAMPYLRVGVLERQVGAREAARKALGHAVERLLVERPERISLLGGGFAREALVEMCESELSALKGGERT